MPDCERRDLLPNVNSLTTSATLQAALYAN
jgi:hypothetical protein